MEGEHVDELRNLGQRRLGREGVSSSNTGKQTSTIKKKNLRISKKQERKNLAAIKVDPCGSNL